MPSRNRCKVLTSDRINASVSAADLVMIGDLVFGDWADMVHYGLNSYTAKERVAWVRLRPHHLRPADLLTNSLLTQDDLSKSDNGGEEKRMCFASVASALAASF